MSFYRAAPNEHLALAKHLMAEAKTEEFVAGPGVVTKWEQVRRQNRWFDARYNASAAGYFCGTRLLGETVKRRPAQRRPAVISTGISRGDGLPWIDTYASWRIQPDDVGVRHLRALG